MNLYRAHVLVCGGTGCHASNSNEIHNRLELKIKELGLEREIKVEIGRASCRERV